MTKDDTWFMYIGHTAYNLLEVVFVKNRIRYVSLLPIYLLVLTGFLLVAVGGSRAVTVLSVNTPPTYTKTVVIDAGHGGVDGGATSCTGVLESSFNLEIAIKLNDLMHLLGINTVMIRDTDCSVYTEGETIAQKKISDLRERVQIVNSIDEQLGIDRLFVDEAHSYKNRAKRCA